ncbi:Rv3654c family TadE-like protein [Curtobacterium sp. MCBD17_032]|uniref:Rv3654c family TadE-like protein n=1 Tax=Curtobacterium sp. MCBD17_032 TaxID=2175659 RepID=UPI002815F7B0|nr:Rv3654c family TadE-like protein [Curtobacterium sp. MCBD17_032]
MLRRRVRRARRARRARPGRRWSGVVRVIRIATGRPATGPERPATRGRPVRSGPVTECGSAAVLLVAVLAAVSLVVMSALTAAGLRVTASRAQGAADAAALAAAAASVDLVPGPPCAAARRSARAVGAELRTCSVTGARARVVVVVGSGPLSVGAVSVAGPQARAVARPGPEPPTALSGRRSHTGSGSAGHPHRSVYGVPVGPPVTEFPVDPDASTTSVGRPAPSIKETRARHEEARDRREPREGEDDRAIPRRRIRSPGVRRTHP